MANAEIEAAARELLAETAQAEEKAFLDQLRDRFSRDVFYTAKRGLKIERLLETGVGRAFAERCQAVVVGACQVWLDVGSSPEDVAKALAEARGAVAAMNCLAGIIQDGQEAEQTLKQIDHEIGASD
jgi:hypothetical protein